MSHTGRRSPRHLRAITWRHAALVALAIILSPACGDPYLHTNPYDPNVPVTFDISGPDSLFSLGEFAQYTVQSTPAFPDTAFSWTVDTVTIIKPDTGATVVDGSTILRPAGAGGYVSIAPPLEPASLTISVTALVGGVDTTVSRYIPQCMCVETFQTQQYRHAGYKPVVLTQRLVRIRVRCPDAHACDTLSVGGAWSVWVDGFDALGHGIVALASAGANPASGPPVATFLSRDTTVASVAPLGMRAANVIARESGTTWVIATRGALADSLQLVVR